MKALPAMRVYLCFLLAWARDPLKARRLQQESTTIGGYGGYTGGYGGDSTTVVGGYGGDSTTVGGYGGYTGGYGGDSTTVGGGYGGDSTTVGGYGGYTGGYGGDSTTVGGYGGDSTTVGGYGGYTGGYGGASTTVGGYYGGYTGGYGGDSTTISGYGGYTGGYGGDSTTVGGYGGYTGGYGGDSTTNGGYGGYTGGYGSGYMGYCPEMWCYPTVYTTLGEIDWDATYSAEVTCSTWDLGCPCNDDWEIECESYGYKVCTLKSEGCYDPFAVECSEYEHVCQDEWSAYCWDKSWGNCPVYCSYEETYCYAYSYDNSTGEVNWDLPYQEFCANMTTGCPCDEQWEDKCTDSYGYSWCTPKIYPCPLECAMDEQLCYMNAYLDNGESDWSVSGEQSCAPMNGSCPCHEEHEEKCTEWWGSYCQPKTYGSCPVSCTADEIYCYATPYDEYGEIDWYGTWEETCHPAADGCPCNAQWEKKCTDSEGGWSWCIPNWDSCPVDCGTNPTCYHWSGNQSCGTQGGCTCESDEHACQDAAGYTECYPKVYYESGCPLVCNYDTDLYCYEVGFDSSGWMTWTEFCHPKTSPDDWNCPVICKNETAKKCDDNWGGYCVSLDDTCPEVCTSEQQNCWVTDYSATGEWLDGRDVCAPIDDACPCGENSQLCTDAWGWSYCESTYFGCPLVCTSEQKYCYPISYTPEGEWDSNAPINETCISEDDTCPCGANAKPCRWTDDWGYEEEYCMADAWSCPVTCTTGQKRCYKTDYNSSGYPETYSESCVSEDSQCQCGTYSQSCYDPWFNENFCYPTWDFWSNTKITCPVYCQDNEDYCFVPSYDAQGDYLSYHEYCVPSGEQCDCTKGQNAFQCTWTDPFYGSWTECLPTTGGYCPATCTDGQVACDMVEDYLPNGTSLGWFSPPTKCADSVEQCPCGKEAERCPNSGCIFKDEGCPVTCTETQKKCYIVDLNANGELISDREACVAESEACPCGKNTVKCENSDVCLSQADAAIHCPCKASETECDVVDYDKAGQSTKFKTECVKEGNSCPCGTNTIGCPDPNDALKKICSPSAEHKKCPAPCEAEAILAGNKTCVQINLDSQGEFKSESVTCIGPDQTCPAGEGMKTCPSTARIKASQTCMNLYSAATNQTRRLNARRKLQTTATRLTCTAIITLSSLSGNALSNSENVRVLMNSVLQIPSGLSTTLAVKTSSRRMDATRALSRALQSSGGALSYVIDNKGATGLSVTPSQVCEQLKKMVKSSNPDLAKAVEAVGVINAQAGVNLELESTTITSRTQAAQQQRAAQAGVTTRSTTTTTTTSTTTTTTTTTTTAGGTTVDGTTANDTTTAENGTTTAAGDTTMAGDTTAAGGTTTAAGTTAAGTTAGGDTTTAGATTTAAGSSAADTTTIFPTSTRNLSEPPLSSKATVCHISALLALLAMY